MLRSLRAHLNDQIFPEAPAVRGPLGRGEYALLATAAIVLAVILQLVRVGDASLHSLWAEDGPIFLRGAQTHSFLEALFSTYSKYLVLIQRLIGETATLVPLRAAPAAISIASALVVAISGLVVWQAAAGLIRSPYLRGGLVLAMVLTPVGGLESLDSAAYVSWYMLFAVFWILLWRPRTALGTILGSLFVLITALSNPGVWFFAPVAVLRALCTRTWRDAAIVGSYATGAAIQLVVLALSDEEAVQPSWTHQIWSALLQRVVNGAAFGLRLGGVAWAHFGWALLILLTVAGLALLGWGLRDSRPRPRWLAAMALPIALAMFVASLYQRAVGGEMAWAAGAWNGNGGRYAIVPVLLVIACALVLIEDVINRAPRERRRPRVILLGGGAMGLLAVAVVTSFPMGDSVARGTPSWDSALDAAGQQCAREGVPTVAVETSPPGFGTEVSCAEVGSFSSPR